MNTEVAPLKEAVLKGVVVGKDIRVWCEYCRKYHIHGYTGETITHRVAHCHNDKSPFYGEGYTIIITGVRE